MAPVNNLPERVCLITPPSVFLLDERVFPSLGILKIGAVLEQRGVAVDMIDLSGVENYLEPLREYLEKASVVHIGITTTTPQLPATTRVIEVIRATRPDISIILGGPHVTLVAAAARLERKANRVSRGHRALQSLHELCDVLVAGDGEEAVFVALCPDAPRFVDADDPAP